MTASAAALLRDAAAQHPHALAVSVDGGAALTYGDWERRAGAAASGLRAAGVRPANRVALLYDNARWTDYAVAYVAVGSVGAVAMPLSSELSSLEVLRVLRHSGDVRLLAPRDLAPSGLDAALLPAETLEDQRPSGDGPGDAGGDTAEILHTSRPLAAPVAEARTVATILDRCRRQRDVIGAEAVLLHWWPVGAAPGQDALWGTLLGLPVRVLDGFAVDRVCALLAEGDASVCSLHPAAAGALLDAARAAGRDLSRLRAVILGSGQVPEWLRRRLGAQLPRTQVIDGNPRVPAAVAQPRAVAARPEVRAAVAAAWRRLLGSSASAHDGVRSSRVLRLVEDALDVDLPVQAFLDAPTQDGLCAVAERALGDRSVAASTDVDGPAPAAFSQEGMIWYECFAPGCQNLPGLARSFKGPLDVAALGRALDDIVHRHQPLRSTFAAERGRLLQVVHPPEHVPLDVVDLSGLASEEQAAAVEERVSAAGALPFDLVDGPLFAPSLLRLGPHEHVLVIRTHHSVFDDWSVGVFRRLLSELYAAHAAGRDPELPVPPAGFAAFARDQRRRMAGDTGADEIEYWRAELSGSPLTTQLPVHDPAAPAGSVQRPGGPLTATLSDAERAAVQDLARRERTTVFAVVLAAFATLVRRVTAQQDLLLSTVVANRNGTELERLIGCFTKRVPLRLDLRGDPSFSAVVSRTRAALLGSLAHQDLPFEAVVQEVLGGRAQAHGLVPHLVVMVQGVTPRQELALPAVDSTGFETSSRAPRAHFMAAAEQPRRDTAVWGGGLYLGTFVILSVATDDDVSCVLRGAFDSAAGAELLGSFRRVLGAAVAQPERCLSELDADLPATPPPGGEDLDGFRVDPARVAAELSRCPGVLEATARIVRGHDTAPRLEAEIMPAADPPGDQALRACMWQRLPGYAWPAEIRVPVPSSGSGRPERTADTSPADAFETVLGALWAEVLGIPRCLPDDNYWQDFSFLEALARARDAGMRVPGAAVTRNRTLRTLAAALAAASVAGR